MMARGDEYLIHRSIYSRQRCELIFHHIEFTEIVVQAMSSTKLAWCYSKRPRSKGFASLWPAQMNYRGEFLLLRQRGFQLGPRRQNIDDALVQVGSSQLDRMAW